MRFALAAVLVCACTAPGLSDDTGLSGDDIVRQVYANAGGDIWANPRSAYMSGYGLFWSGSSEPVRHERHAMWRVYPEAKGDAHQADGRVRIDSWRDGEIAFQLSFDGEHTYTQQGRLDESADSSRWASNFGFGVIRHALDEGYSVVRGPDDLVGGRESYTITIVDPAEGETLFSIAQDDFAILKLAFSTPRGWHERYYSDFFTDEATGWVQPGRVRLFYNGIKANEVIWTDVEINADWPDTHFVLEAPAAQ